MFYSNWLECYVRPSLLYSYKDIATVVNHNSLSLMPLFFQLIIPTGNRGKNLKYKYIIGGPKH